MKRPLQAYAPTVSVVLLNHRRPQLLERVLRGVAQLDYPAFEIVIVGDRPSLGAYQITSVPTGTVRYIPFTQSNICAARNLGIAQAGGDIIAFCDDDAVPEPNWLRALVAPFAVSQVGAVSGTVLSSDGLSVEWQGRCFDRAAVEHPLATPDSVRIVDAASQSRDGLYASLIGANSAFRASALREIGGFDEAYRYFLDETDVALRLADAGWSTAFAREAVVNHYSEGNASRGHLRTPRNVHEIAASKAYFCKRHLEKDRLEASLLAFRAERRLDFDPYVRLGLLRQTTRNALETQIDAGLIDGLARETRTMPPAETPPAFQPFAGTPGEDALSIAVITGWGLGRVKRMRRAAKRFAAAGHRVSCLSFMTGGHARSVTFEDGVWVHRGGTWRTGHTYNGRPIFARAKRAAAELERIAEQRSVDVIVHDASSFARGLSPAQRQKVILDTGGQYQPMAIQIRSTVDLTAEEILDDLGRCLTDQTAIGRAAPGASQSGLDPARNPTYMSP